jgi:hypothetical protein
VTAGVLVLIAAVVFAWGALSARLERGGGPAGEDSR